MIYRYQEHQQVHDGKYEKFERLLHIQITARWSWSTILPWFSYVFCDCTVCAKFSKFEHDLSSISFLFFTYQLMSPFDATSTFAPVQIANKSIIDYQPCSVGMKINMNTNYCSRLITWLRFEFYDSISYCVFQLQWHF